MRIRIVSVIVLMFIFQVVQGQSDRPLINAFHTEENIRIDGSLAEADWFRADSIASLTMVEPVIDGNSTHKTVTRVLSDSRNIYFGIICYDSEPDNIVAFTKARDTKLEDEDNIKLVLDTYFDGRNGFIFSINPYAARYDAIVSNNGESENANWDGIWEAKTTITDYGWVAEIKIPVSSLTFKRNINSWGFNIERRVHRLMEVDRWTAISQDYKLGQTIQAGVLANLSEFNLGLGMTPSVSAVTKISHNAGEKAVAGFRAQF